jgi:hypothetical protein
MAYPTVESISSNNAALAASHTVTLPTGITSGDYLLMWFAADKAQTFTVTGWVEEFYDDMERFSLGSGAGALFSRDADGTEGSTVSVGLSNSQEAAWYCWRISGHDTTTTLEYANNASTSTNPDPPNLTPSWGSKDTLWLTCACIDNLAITAGPTSWTNFKAESNGDANIGTARLESTNTSENPGTFTSSSDDWITVTIGIQPSGGAAAGSLITQKHHNLIIR